MSKRNHQNIFTLTNIAASISLFVPIFYIVGHLYLQGYLSVYNQSVDSLSLPFESILMKSFYVISGSIIQLFISFVDNIIYFFSFAAFIFVYSVIIIFTASHSEKMKKKIEEKKVSLRKSNLFNYGFVPTAIAIISAGGPFLLLTALAAILMAIWSSYSYGERLAKEEITDFAYCKEKQKAVCTTIIESNGIKTVGVLIASSDKFIALYTGQKVVLINNQNLKIETKPRV
ncbi:hypothetical protein [Pseudoalteromonas sp. UCD-33C]|uniref:hypothetical protein n=1 Tax=Pseudoalteromonas sp. UCD-33C TaxID=1716175 RepID=UPI0006CA3B8D|nr:hypothetical protein [Pseudoalteromonas sp. UCD-33C]KPM80272.1 hypothetical protein AOG26_03010 [Pseudoalteromonas sp. UCD-33C]